jgi:hypothetical protein
MRKNASLQLDEIFFQVRHQLAKSRLFHHEIKRRADRAGVHRPGAKRSRDGRWQSQS